VAYPDPVFVGGAGGSGAFSVGRLVGAHSRYAEVPARARFHAVPEGLPGFLRGSVSAKELVRRVRTAWLHLPDENGRELGLAGIVGEDDLHAALAQFEREAAEDRLRAARGLVHAILDPVAARERKPSWVETTPATALTAPALLQMFPAMRVIHCIRDGRDVAADVARQADGYDFDGALDWWVERVVRIDRQISRLPFGSALVLRIEDLAGSKREAAWRGLLDFLVLDEEPAMRTRAEEELELVRADIGAWREGLTDGDAQRVTALYEERLRRLADADVAWAPQLADDYCGAPLALLAGGGSNGSRPFEHSGTYDGPVTLPYTVDEVGGAKHLLVTFAGLTLEASDPPVEMRKRVGSLRAHRMFIGADSDYYFGPQRKLAGAQAAIGLVRREARRLGVPEQNVITYGVSAASLAALYVGLKVEAGHIFAGAPPIRAGGWVLKLERAVAPSADAAGMRRALVGRTGVHGDPNAALFYDRLIWRAAQRAAHEATIHLFASPDDLVVRDAEWFNDVLRDHPTLTCRVEIQDYGAHSWAKLPFFGYMQRALLPELGAYS
jgi:hypothetical protein